ncbi:hypothetical protein [Natrinema sp. DC36]|uniref:hypothetical protein n=1 Tax=Natrinema sp. DC36 TaxID=2878680 RepID=UPI001CF036E2|nr:hypothetical protein [Natrinema sp. DC36]
MSQDKDTDVRQIINAVADGWNEFDGLPPYSAEYERDKFALSIQKTNCYEISLHHPSGEDTGMDGYAKTNVLDQSACDTVKEAKKVVENYSNNPNEYLG